MANTTSDRFANFHQIKAVPYGSLRSKSLPTDILLPKGIQNASGPRPILVVVHGGGLIGGTRDFQPWWPIYLLEYAAQHNAIIVAPDYPLAPESKTPEILQSLKAFFEWLVKPGALQSAIDSHLPAVLNLPAASTPKVEADISRILLQGESAGGWAALHLAYLYPDAFRGLLLRFPMIDMDDRAHFDRDFGANEFLGGELQPVSYYDKHLASMAEGSVSLGDEPGRLDLIGAILLHGRIYHALGESDDTFPLRRLERGEIEKMPKRIWVLHGAEDGLVPATGSAKLAGLLREKVPASQLEYDTTPGDHGMDHEWLLDGEEKLLRKRLDWLGEEWLQ